MTEQSAGGRVKAEPAHGQHPRQMTMSDDGDIAVVHYQLTHGSARYLLMRHNRRPAYRHGLRREHALL